MPNDFHPDDERLAAYADRETDALRDRALGEHLAGCGRCRLILNDLGALRSALAELPDLAPSRPLRLIPPVPASAPRAVGRAGWLRRLTAPVFAVGTGLVLVGAVGASGALNVYQAASTGGRETDESAYSRASDAPPAVQATDNEYAGGSGAQQPDASSRGSTDGSSGEITDGSTGRSPDASPGEFTGATESPPGKGSDPATPAPDSESVPAFPAFVVLLLVGIALVAVAAIMRFTLQPRAG
ncbi:MAG: zf-HC2 domain-containing protein [Chloroflexota bacterium]|nr:zf-HC2 domain-containing protein [Chloroflexota bacterium]